MELATTNKGLEKITAQEISNHAKILEEKEEIILFETKELDKICYLNRGAERIIQLLGKGKTKKISEEIPTLLKGLTETYSVDVERKGEHPFTSQDILGEITTTLRKQGATVDFKKGKKIFCLIKNDEYYLGFDLTGDMARRDYRIFLKANSLRGNIAYAMLKIAGFTGKESLLDPFCRDGIIPIEAALLSKNMSPRYYTKEKLDINKKIAEQEDKKIKENKAKIYCADINFGNVQNARKNAKIAGVVKDIDFSRQELRYLFLKMPEVDLIITVPIQPAQTMAEKKIKEIYTDLFRIKAKTIVMAMTSGKEIIKETAKNYKITEMEIWQGKQKVDILKLEHA